MSTRAGVVIPAGGAGRRMGGVHKPFLDLCGRTLLEHAIEPFLQNGDVAYIVVAVPQDVLDAPPAWLSALAPRVTLVQGGAERGDSVRNGIDAFAAFDNGVDVILVHDAARPLVSADVIARCIAAAAEGRSVIAAVPVVDTIKEVDEGGRISGTPDRRFLWSAQTPQAFPAAVLRDAYQKAKEERINATDDAALVARYGTTVTVVEGSSDNIKITSHVDLTIAEAIIEERLTARPTRSEPPLSSMPQSAS